jgi:hypothetical protein
MVFSMKAGMEDASPECAPARGVARARLDREERCRLGTTGTRNEITCRVDFAFAGGSRRRDGVDVRGGGAAVAGNIVRRKRERRICGKRRGDGRPCAGASSSVSLGTERALDP